MENDLVFSECCNSIVYARTYHKTNDTYCKKVAKLYNKDTAFLVPSGMCAISTTLHSIISNNSNKKIILYFSSELFCLTKKLIVEHLPSIYKNVTCKEINPENIKENIDEVEFDSLNILFVESATNPNGIVCDFNAINQLDKKRNIIIVDNTFLTHELLNPFDYGSAIVISSLTKHYSNGKGIGGIIILQDDSPYAKIINEWIEMNGLHVSPHNAKIFLEQIDTLQDRILRSSELMKQILAVLVPLIMSKNNQIIFSHHSTSKNAKYIKNNLLSSVFTLRMITDKNILDLEKLLSTNDFFKYLPSFGDEDNKINSFPTLIGKELTIRISIGNEETSCDNVVTKLLHLIDLI